VIEAILTHVGLHGSEGQRPHSHPSGYASQSLRLMWQPRHTRMALVSSRNRMNRSFLKALRAACDIVANRCEG